MKIATFTIFVLLVAVFENCAGTTNVAGQGGKGADIAGTVYKSFVGLTGGDGNKNTKTGQIGGAGDDTNVAGAGGDGGKVSSKAVLYKTGFIAGGGAGNKNAGQIGGSSK